MRAGAGKYKLGTVIEKCMLRLGGQDRTCGPGNINTHWKKDFVQPRLLSILLSMNTSFVIKDYRILHNCNETGENTCLCK